MQTQLTSEYWDKVAQSEPIGNTQTTAEAYTQYECVKAFTIAAKQIPEPFIIMLKTDLWTEGIVRNREILETGIKKLKQQVYADAIDISPEICSKAIQYIPRAIQGSITKLPYDNKRFDLILDSSTIDHVNSNDQYRAISEYSRCLVDKGMLSIAFSHKQGTLDKEVKEDYFTIDIGYFEWMLRANNFKIIRRYCIHSLNTLPVAYLTRFKFIYKVFEFLEFTWFSHFLHRLAPMYVIIAQKM